jgi:superfamily II DNA/RNA helicase
VLAEKYAGAAFQAQILKGYLCSLMSYSIDKILGNLKIAALNEMQLASIEANKVHKDVILLSATGSGKTLAFLLPMLDRMDFNNTTTTQAMIVVPTRELALQIEQVFRTMSTGLKITACYGGHKREIEENSLVHPPAVIVGTPGRLGDHIRRGSITLDTITTLILDEFDKSLELGFQDEVGFILGSLPNLEKRLLTSATDAVELPDFLGLEDAETVSFVTGEEEGEALEMEYLVSQDKDKADTLFRLICAKGDKLTIVFCNHRDAVERTSNILHDKGIVNEFYHGAMEQREREAALGKFRNGTVNVLVTTDLASRGLDIPFIRNIIHYHLPHNEDIFTHRNGRTARMEATGTAILILSPEETLPEYIDQDKIKEIDLPDEIEIPRKPEWVTLYVDAGKKDKINKVDIVGFLAQKGELKKEDIGLIEVKDFFAFVAVRKTKANNALHAIKGERIKGKMVLIEVAK